MAIGCESQIVKRLKEAGLLPEGTQRIVIDIPCSEPIKIYYQTIANDISMGEIFNDDLCIQELQRVQKAGVCMKCGYSVVDITKIGDKYRSYACDNPECERYIYKKGEGG